MNTQKEVKNYLKTNLPKEIYKRINPRIISNIFNGKKTGCYVAIDTPAWVNIDVDENFNILFNGITYRISNKKVSVGIWMNANTSAHIVVY